MGLFDFFKKKDTQAPAPQQPTQPSADQTFNPGSFTSEPQTTQTPQAPIDGISAPQQPVQVPPTPSVTPSVPPATPTVAPAPQVTPVATDITPPPVTPTVTPRPQEPADNNFQNPTQPPQSPSQQ